MLHQHDTDMDSYEASMARLRSQDQSPIYQERLHRIRQSVRVMLDSQTDEDVLGMESLMLQEEGVERVYSTVPNEPSKRARFIREAKGRLVDHLKDKENSYLDSLPLMQEKLFYKESRAFVPPPDLWEQHETFVNLWKAYRELKPRMPGYKARRSVLEALKTKVREPSSLAVDPPLMVYHYSGSRRNHEDMETEPIFICEPHHYFNHVRAVKFPTGYLSRVLSWISGIEQQWLSLHTIN